MGGGSGNGGYTADPQEMRTYVGTLNNYAGMIGEGGDAANSVMKDNSFTLDKDPLMTKAYSMAGLQYTGRLDLAYGLLCQPMGELMESVQQKTKDGIDGTATLMSKLASNVKSCADSYRQNEQLVTKSMKAVPMPTIPTFPGK